jgi:hypothetical protein
MKRLVAAVATLALTAFATPAAAFLVEVTTSVAVQDHDDNDAVKNAIRSAVDSVLSEAIAFTPTLVVLTHARLVGGRLWLRLLIADQEGEAAFGDLHGGEDEREPGPSTAEIRI